VLILLAGACAADAYDVGYKDLARLFDEGKAVQIRLRRNADAAREQYITLP
jgi:hypothetical protein